MQHHWDYVVQWLQELVFSYKSAACREKSNIYDRNAFMVVVATCQGCNGTSDRQRFDIVLPTLSIRSRIYLTSIRHVTLPSTVCSTF